MTSWLNELSQKKNTTSFLLDVNDPPEGLLKSSAASFQFSFVQPETQPTQEETFGIDKDANEFTIDFASLLSSDPQDSKKMPIQVNCTLSDLVNGESSAVFKSVLAELSDQGSKPVINVEGLIESEVEQRAAFNLDAPEFKLPVQTSPKKAITIRSPDEPTQEIKLPTREIKPPTQEIKLPTQTVFDFKPRQEPAFEIPKQAKPITIRAPGDLSKKINLDAPEFKPTKNHVGINLNAAVFEPPKKSVGVYQNGLFIPTVKPSLN
ncbi:hypothetical protein G6F56_011266 [Rhizopus delemar]|uniref:Uncharacterized protein n=1 Tax=Rhizopus stolonifer TaxID=4846 RepID=A0A367JH70_RHIST|nr:hypothetical protein G6F56_011266 [Rhizopus delemar]RCH89267.1 hypothetical protein CU098_005306 [Rhizopus stolonifer]